MIALKICSDLNVLQFTKMRMDHPSNAKVNFQKMDRSLSIKVIWMSHKNEFSNPIWDLNLCDVCWIKLLIFWENKFIKNSPLSLWGIMTSSWIIHESRDLRQSPLYTHFPILILIFNKEKKQKIRKNRKKLTKNF